MSDVTIVAAIFLAAVLASTIFHLITHGVT